MITFKNTPNLTGVNISGDFNDLYSLVEALHEILHFAATAATQIVMKNGVRFPPLC